MDNITHLFPTSGKPLRQVSFDRQELAHIMDVYGRCVAAQIFRDYALSMDSDAAVFSAFERATERPDVQIVKQPALARRQGAYALIGRSGTVLKRGHDLRAVLSLLERKLLKAVNA